jgi:hypothetical protein
VSRCNVSYGYTANSCGLLLCSFSSAFANNARSIGSSTSRRRTPQSLLSMTGAVPPPPLHVLAISEAVARLRWRPPAGEINSQREDRHRSMLAVATGSLKGSIAGGSGVLALWSYHRPFMPLSVLEGHQGGAVTDFVWVDSPPPAQAPLRAGIWQHAISVGRDGQCLLQSFARGKVDFDVFFVPLVCRI